MPQKTILIVIAVLFMVYGFSVFSSYADNDNGLDEKDQQTDAGILKFIHWLGKFHPDSTHFPIALIIAAGIAEILFVKTGKILFDDARRYCLWFGILSAIGTGTLGWFFGGFELVDEDWLLTTHRWLGTSTVFSSLLLGIAEWSRSKYVIRRVWYQIMHIIVILLISATGFFGGAMIYGLNHYAW